MTMARSHLVDPSVTRWYHCMTKCVRGADLLTKVPEDRKAVDRFSQVSVRDDTHMPSRAAIGAVARTCPESDIFSR